MVELVNAFVSGLLQIFAWSTFGLMLLGMAIGFAVGILPGLGGPTTLALMLPFIIKMTPIEAFAFLLGMISVTSTTGDITSILFGVPGEASTAATIVDGHPMAKKGEGGRALGAALLSSLVGAIFGAFALALAIPIVRPLVLTFESPEFFMLAIVGLTFVASLSGEALLKGLIAGSIGLLFSTIGLSQTSGVQRYTFGQLFLWDGIGLVPISIGFWAIPEIIDLSVQGTSIAVKGAVGKLGGVMEGVKDTFRHFWMVIRCSSIGTYIGLIPGMGTPVVQWLAYGHAVQSSREKERFGKGAVEGVLGPGAANNSALGGHLVTTVAFGIPASLSMAILLGAFIIQGIVPGPDMLIPEVKGGHLTLTFSFVWTIIISNVITVGVCFLFLNQLVKVTQLRNSLVVPFILLMVYLGAFAEKNAFEDIILMLFFGVLGWLMSRFNWPRPPVLLGLVLGSLAEHRFLISYRIYGFGWLLRPGVLFLIVLALAGAFYPTIKTWFQKQKGGKEESPSPKALKHDGLRHLNFNWKTLFSLFIVTMFIFALWESRHFNFRTGLFPWFIGFPALALAITQFVRDLVVKEEKRGYDHLVEAGPDLPIDVVNRRTASIFGWILGYFVTTWLFGFVIGIPLCTFIQLKMGYRERWPISLILTAFTWVFIYGLFKFLLHVPFPPGLLLLLLNI